MRDLLQIVRRSLKREAPLSTPPTPPAIDEPITRLVHSEFGLPELFAKRATEMKMLVTRVRVEELVDQLSAWLTEKKLTKLVLANRGLVKKLDIATALAARGFAVKCWHELAENEIYNGFDCGITDVTFAVAETGSLVIKPSAEHGRAVSLVPFFHIAILEPKNFVPDLVDLMEKVAADPQRHNWFLITGPSKTADIEMNVVTGVHGPNVVHAFVLK